jgi:c-di-GMP-binding flagellar brake protein YcgR
MNAKPPRQERRSFRVSCYASVVVEVRGQAQEKGATLSGLAANVSLEGASVMLPASIPAGTRVGLKLLGPERPGALETVQTEKQAEVVWVRATPDTCDASRHGLRFIEPDVDVLLRAWPGEQLPE